MSELRSTELGSLVDPFKDARFRHWGLQVRHYVYDLSRSNRSRANDDDEFDKNPVFEFPILAPQWEAKHYSEGEKRIKIPVGITFRSDNGIDQAALTTWYTNPHSGEYSLRSKQCQHFVTSLYNYICANDIETALVSPTVLASLKPLNRPIWMAANLTPAYWNSYKAGYLVKQRVTADGLADPKFDLLDRSPYSRYQEALVDRYSRLGFPLRHVVALLQRLGVHRFSSWKKLDAEIENLLLKALEGKIVIDDRGRVVSSSYDQDGYDGEFDRTEAPRDVVLGGSEHRTPASGCF